MNEHVGCSSLFDALNRVTVIRATPSRGAITLRKGINESNNRSVSTSNHEESSEHNNEDAPANHGRPSGRSTIVSGPVVVKPHNSLRLEAEKGAEECTDKGDEATESRNTRRDAVGDDGCDGSAADPSAPVRYRVGCQMAGATEDAEKDIFGRDLLDCQYRVPAFSNLDRNSRGDTKSQT